MIRKETVAAIWLSVIIGFVQGNNIFMDSPVFCGRTIPIFDRTYTIRARAEVSTSNPDYSCLVTITSGYEDSYYQIQITQKMIAINDCVVKLNIFEGSQTGGAAVKRLSCTTKSTGVLYSKGGTVTFQLITPKSLHNTRNDFAIDVRAFRDPNAPAYESGGARLSAGAIVGVIVGILVLVAFTIILFWCYRENKLPGMNKYGNRRNTRNTTQSHNGYTNSDYNYSKEPSLASEAPSKKLYLEDQGVFPSIDSMADNSLNGSANGLKKTPIANWNINTRNQEDPNFQNASRSRYQTDADGRGRYQKADQGRGRTQSTGNSPSRQRREEFNQPNKTTAPPVGSYIPPPPPIHNLPAPKHMRDNYGQKQADDDNMSGVKRRKQRLNQNEGDAKRPNSGIFDNPDNEGYMYDYDQVKKLASDDKDNQENHMLHELKRELSRRQSMREGKGDNEGKSKKEKENETNEKKSDDAPGAPVSKTDQKKSNEKPTLPETGKIEGKYKAIDQQSEIGDPDMISNPLMGNNPAIRASVSELRGSTSPGTRKKKRRKSHKKYVKADPVSENGEYRPGDETSTEKPTDIDESFDRDSMFNDSYRLPKSGQMKDTPLPPEAMAPVFATDESVMQHYYPQNQYEMQNQVYPVMGYDAFGNPVYGNPVPLSVAYAQPGYYVDQHGYPVNTQQQQMQPIQFQSPTDFHPGMPGYTSTPFNPDQTPHIKHSPHHGRKKRTKSSPHDALAPGGPSPILPAGNILDDHRIPQPGQTLMNSGIDPHTGVKTSQVVWTDAKPDPTDPTGGNPQITRQTIVRVTARDTEDGQLPQPPNAGLQQMTFSAAKQLKNEANADPAFLSPSKGQFGAVAYTPQPVHASKTPERDNAGFYTRVPPPEQNQLTSAPKPVVHSSARSYSVRDKITLQPEESEF